MQAYNALILSAVAILGLAAAAVVALFVGRMIRNRMMRPERPAAFTLEDLRQMRAEGQITEQEFTAMRAMVLAQTRAGAKDGQSPRPGGGAPRPPRQPDDEGEAAGGDRT